MKEFIKNLYYNTRIGYLIISIPKYFYDLYRFKMLSDKTFIKRQFKKTFGYELNLKHPKTFTEKIQWLKLNDRTSLQTLCADKLSVRDYIKEKIGEQYLIPLIYYTNNAKELILDKLPDYPVIIKTNHGSGGVIIVKDKQSIDIRKIQQKLKIQLNQNYYTRSKEWEYKNIKPCIIVEQLLQDESNNDILNDYKVHCFNGSPQYIQTIFDRTIEVKENWYDAKWNLLDVHYFSPIKKYLPKPKLLNELLNVATILSTDFIYVRVDLYISNNQIYFGELTFHPYGGFMKFHPQEFDKILGDKLKLPIEV